MFACITGAWLIQRVTLYKVCAWALCVNVCVSFVCRCVCSWLTVCLTLCV